MEGRQEASKMKGKEEKTKPTGTKTVEEREGVLEKREGKNRGEETPVRKNIRVETKRGVKRKKIPPYEVKQRSKKIKVKEERKERETCPSHSRRKVVHHKGTKLNPAERRKNTEPYNNNRETDGDDETKLSRKGKLEKGSGPPRQRLVKNEKTKQSEKVRKLRENRKDANDQSR